MDDRVFLDVAFDGPGILSKKSWDVSGNSLSYLTKALHLLLQGVIAETCTIVTAATGRLDPIY